MSVLSFNTIRELRPGLGVIKVKEAVGYVGHFGHKRARKVARGPL
jgi:hypothetical protein